MAEMDKRPVVVLRDLDGPGGNTLAILSQCKGAARAAGWSRDLFKAFQDEMLSGDREHAIDTVFDYFDVVGERRVVTDVDRDAVQ